MASQLIIALDYDNLKDALTLVDQLDPKSCCLKVGSELFTRLGEPFINLLISRQFKVFLDLKFHDIPNTVAKACKAAADLGVWMLTVHASGGSKMMAAAKASVETYANRPLIVAVTVLTSFHEEELRSIGISYSLLQQVKSLARLAKEAGLDGVVSSAFEVQEIKKDCGTNFISVTPGIRLSSDSLNDQTRVMTPQQAVRVGSDFIVVGRPVTQASAPAAVVTQILKDLRTKE